MYLLDREGAIPVHEKDDPNYTAIGAKSIVVLAENLDIFGFAPNVQDL